jgi:hypothetical protein
METAAVEAASAMASTAVSSTAVSAAGRRRTCDQKERKHKYHKDKYFLHFSGPLKPGLTAFFPGPIPVPLLLELQNLGPHNME